MTLGYKDNFKSYFCLFKTTDILSHTQDCSELCFQLLIGDIMQLFYNSKTKLDYDADICCFKLKYYSTKEGQDPHLPDNLIFSKFYINQHSHPLNFVSLSYYN